MTTIELAKRLISRDEIKKGTNDFLEDSVSAILGDPIAAAQIIYSLMKSPMFFREQLFWTKFEMFLNGIDVTEDERSSFCAKLTLDGAKKENVYRLIQAIDHAETNGKVNYLINVSRCLSAAFIEHPVYFRICHIITNSLEEDLDFLKEHIVEDSEYEYGDIIQGLMNNGLMYQSVLDANGDNRYRFTSLAEVIDRYSLSYNNIERYTMCGESNTNQLKNQVTKVDAMAKWG